MPLQEAVTALKDGGFLAGAGVALLCGAKAATWVIPLLRPQANGNGNGNGGAKEEGRWQGSVTAILEQQTDLMRQFQQGQSTQTLALERVATAAEKTHQAILLHDAHATELAASIRRNVA